QHQRQLRVAQPAQRVARVEEAIVLDQHRAAPAPDVQAGEERERLAFGADGDHAEGGIGLERGVQEARLAVGQPGDELHAVPPESARRWGARGGSLQWARRPPSSLIPWPEMFWPRSEQRNAASQPMSSGVCARRSGIMLFTKPSKAVLGSGPAISGPKRLPMC